ncbi:hypothetical protein EZV62_015971 [Acer yangbiense]|uniref:Protein kinase domain-containing protein n=1 Tax=Acer yangbiense TaxID=1000413 RepID=A0A5C7HPN4_9ROSI|nr:hypothetical protein EZV62_015971 [Acer yangbiense]
MMLRSGFTGPIDVVANIGSLQSLWLHGNHFTGAISDRLGNLTALKDLNFNGNQFVGLIPASLADLQLDHLDLNNNLLRGTIPKFKAAKVTYNSNVFCQSNPGDLCALESRAPSGINPPSGSSDSSPNNPSTSTKGSSSSSNSSDESTKLKSSKRTILVAIVAPVASIAIIALLVIPLSIYYCKKRKDTIQAPSSLVIHPRDPSNTDNMVKIVVANNSNVTISTVTVSGSASTGSSGVGESHVIEAGNLVISVQVLRNVTKNFAPENELGRGGFGVVYKGELEDGTKIAVKKNGV